MLTYEEFKSVVKDSIVDYLPERFSGAEISIGSVYKNNAKLDAIIIRDESTNITPSIYLNPLYEKYQNGWDIKEVLENIVDMRIEYAVNKDYDIAEILDFDKVKNQIMPSLVGKEGNEAYLHNNVCTNFADLAVMYRVVIEQAEIDGTATIPITNDLLKNWNVSVEEVHAAAVENMDTLCKPGLVSMLEQMQLLTGEELDVPPGPDEIFILCNREKMFGANAVLHESTMDKVSEFMKDDYFLIPSSVHEWLVVPGSCEMGLDVLEAMVQEVNRTAVEPQDRLSDHVYKYDVSTHELYRADQEKEHFMAKESRKDKDRASLKDRLHEKQQVVQNSLKKDQTLSKDMER